MSALKSTFLNISRTPTVNRFPKSAFFNKAVSDAFPTRIVLIMIHLSIWSCFFSYRMFWKHLMKAKFSWECRREQKVEAKWLSLLRTPALREDKRPSIKISWDHFKEKQGIVDVMCVTHNPLYFTFVLEVYVCTKTVHEFCLGCAAIIFMGNSCKWLNSMQFFSLH